jgi:beta-xylosidase
MVSSRISQTALLSFFLLGAGASPVKRQTYPAAIEKDFPDPSVMQAGDGTYYAYATAGNGVQIQVATSSDGISWSLQEGHDALQSGSIAWAPEDPSVWAPDVTPGPNGVYYMYFSAVASETGDAGKHCIGFATSTDPLGPFQPVSDQPWVCDTDTGDIDPDQFLDEDGSRWVLWKVDGNSAGSDSTPIMIQQVEDDGYTKVIHAMPYSLS